MRFEVGSKIRYYDPFRVEGFIGEVEGFKMDPDVVLIKSDDGLVETVHKKFVNRVVED
jgi:hypothetical protein